MAEEAIYHRANNGSSYEYQLVDVPDYHGRGHETVRSPWFCQNVGEAVYIVSVYMYMCLLGYPVNKKSILTTYNGQKLLIRDVIARRCLPYEFIGPPGKVTTVDKFQGEQNDFILLSLVLLRTSSPGLLNMTEATQLTDCHVEDTGPIHLVSGIEEMESIFNYKFYQA
ncbi:hypothetical protein Vadar_007513 [Vaccinium darrowii]|uniref:Uncharacterized protein n=1 Tax=Vaccinium darrowii TaxID=229202 RepID=A0ACB7XY39_9ERIC|nr:hypothetical protein Vadar_007513 [Vaccinium darrowii]